MTNPKDAAIAFEATKVALRQTKDGTVVSLAIHPDQISSDLLSAKIGARYQVALVEIGDDEQPQRPHSTQHPYVQRAAILCRDSAFHKHVFGKEVSEMEAATYVRGRCGIASRSELAFDEEARRKLDTVIREYYNAASV